MHLYSCFTTKMPKSILFEILLRLIFSSSLALFPITLPAEESDFSVDANASHAPTASLVNTLWRLISMGDKQVEGALQKSRVAQFVLASEAHKLHGYTNCNNRIKARYNLNGEYLLINRVWKSRMSCPKGTGELEKNFIDVLKSTQKWKIEGENLFLLNGDGKILAGFESLYLR